METRPTPPELPNGLEYVRESQQKTCPNCCEMYEVDEPFVIANKAGEMYDAVIPRKHGYCVPCTGTEIAGEIAKRYDYMVKMTKAMASEQGEAQAKKYGIEEADHNARLADIADSIDQLTDFTVIAQDFVMKVAGDEEFEEDLKCP